MERYTGFYIDKPYGNNVFSYEERENKKIFVPKLIEGTLEDVKVGQHIVFNEIDEDMEISSEVEEFNFICGVVIFPSRDTSYYYYYF